MYWSTTDFSGMTKGPEKMENVVHSFKSVEEQIADQDSIYNFYRRAIRIRNENPEIARGIISYMEEIEDTAAAKWSGLPDCADLTSNMTIKLVTTHSTQGSSAR